MTPASDTAEKLVTPMRDALDDEAARLRAHPAFSQMVLAYNKGLARFREAPRLFNKLTNAEVRFRTIAYLLYLAADRERYGPEGGATYSRLHDLCQARDEISPRVLKTTLAILKFLGFVEVRTSAADRRVKIYRPTPKMSQFIDLWLGYAVTALDALEPEMRRTELLRDDPGFVDRFLVGGGRQHMEITPLPDRLPDFVAFFGQREGAGAVITAAVDAGMQGTPMPSRGQLARRFGLSKTQVSNVINEGVSLGYWTLDAQGSPAPTELLYDKFGHWISIELAFYARHMRPA